MATFVTEDRVIGAYTLRRFGGLFGSVVTDVFKNGRPIGEIRNGYLRYYGEGSRWQAVTRTQAFRWWRHAERVRGCELMVYMLPEFIGRACEMDDDEEIVRCLSDGLYSQWRVIKR